MSDSHPPRYDQGPQPHQMPPQPPPTAAPHQMSPQPPPTAAPHQAPPSPTGHQTPHQQDSPLQALADVRFTKFATPRLLTIVYVLTLVMIALTSLIYLGLALVSGQGALIVVALIFIPLVAFLNIIFARIGLEVVAVIHRQRELLQEISNKLSR